MADTCDTSNSPGPFSILLALAWLCSLWPTSMGEMTCKKINSCSCSYDDEQIIDLSPLAGNPKWADQFGPQSVNTYSYNPCHGFDEHSCLDVAVCQKAGSDYYALGTQESAIFVNEPQTGQLSIEYNSTDAIGVTRTSQIVLTCAEDQPDAFNALGETSTGSGYYLFTLTSVHCCPKSGSSDKGSSAGLSYGTYISIGFASLVVIYLMLGMTIQGGLRGKTGSDVIPNYSTWKGFFGLVKDGFLFTFKCGTAPGYEHVKE